MHPLSNLSLYLWIHFLNLSCFKALMSLSIILHRNGPLKNTDFLPLSDLICGILKSLLLRRLFSSSLPKKMSLFKSGSWSLL